MGYKKKAAFAAFFMKIAYASLLNASLILLIASISNSFEVA